MMVWNPNLIFYACIAEGTTILAEFNSKDADLGALAEKCLEKTPSLHSMFSQTTRNMTYTFLINDHFVYFAIFDENLDNSEGVAFLQSVKDAFSKTFNSSSCRNRLENLNTHCFQGEFSPVFQQLLASSSPELDSMHSSRESLKPAHRPKGSSDIIGPKRIGPIPLLSDNSKSLKKKKKRLLGISGDGTKDTKVDVSDDEGGDGFGLSRDFPVVTHRNGLFSGEVGHQKAKRVWKKHVWVVLSLDFIICVILFIIWLGICRGFKCIDG